MKTLTEDLRRDVAQAGNEPLRLLDPASGKEYVLLPAEAYDRMKEILLCEDANFDPRETYASILKAWDKDDEHPKQYLEYLQSQ